MGNLQKLVILGVTLLSVYLLLTYVTDGKVADIAQTMREKEYRSASLVNSIERIYYGNNPRLPCGGLSCAVKLLNGEQSAELVRIGQDLRKQIDELERQLDVSMNEAEKLEKTAKTSMKNAIRNSNFWEEQLSRKRFKSNAEEYIESLDKQIEILEKYLKASQQLEEMIMGIVRTDF
ncbi:hypothetical protein [Helicobacter sp. T3_23-1059]